MHIDQKPRIVIIGGGYAGMVTALRLSGRTKAVSVTLVNASDTFTHRIRNHQVAARQKIRQYTIPGLLGKRPVRFVQGWVSGLSLDSRVVDVKTDEGAQAIGYDYLVYALGSIAARPNIPGGREHTYGIGNYDEACALRDRVAQLQPGAKVIVIGGGLTGIEATTELAESRPDLQVRLVTDGTVGAGLSERGRAYIRKTFGKLHLDWQENTRVRKIETGELQTEHGETIPFDVSVWAGSFGVPALAREAGLAVNSVGQVQVDSTLRSVSHPEVYAVGDAAVFTDRTPLRMACLTATPTGAHAADNLAALVAGKPLQPFSFSYPGQCVSLGRRRGLVQFVNADDTPIERIVTGFAAALIKELICRGSIWALQMEGLAPGSLWWPGKKRLPVDTPRPAERATS